MRLRILAAATLFLLSTPSAFGAPKPEPWTKWEAHDPRSPATVEHAAWDAFLKTYVVTDHPSGIYRVSYADVAPADREALDSYVVSLAAVKVTGLARPEQKAYWINFYNALTVKVVLDRYPVESIRDIRSGLFSPGPWEKKLVTVEGERLTLNDIEHRILRPLWQDNRVHYAVNCASLGCPNLQPVAYTAGNTERLLEKGAREYVNHPRGARLEGQTLVASSIYDWFQVDFGGSEAGVLEHLRSYAEPPLAETLEGFQGGLRYAYDWSLNEP